jgi:hypothetical protein
MTPLMPCSSWKPGTRMRDPHPLSRTTLARGRPCHIPYIQRGANQHEECTWFVGSGKAGPQL